MFEPGDWVIVNKYGTSTLAQVSELWECGGDWLIVQIKGGIDLARPTSCRPATQHEIMEAHHV
jgi:hypothetical protein